MTSCDEIADAVVEQLKTLTTTIAFAPENPPLFPIMDRGVAGPSVQVQPWAEDETATDRGDMLAAARTVNVIVSCPIEGDRTRAECLTWLNEIKEGFREFEIAGGWRWQKNETVTLYDSDALKEKSQFLSLFRATFYNFA